MRTTAAAIKTNFEFSTLISISFHSVTVRDFPVVQWVYILNV